MENVHGTLAGGCGVADGFAGASWARTWPAASKAKATIARPVPRLSEARSRLLAAKLCSRSTAVPASTFRPAHSFMHGLDGGLFRSVGFRSDLVPRSRTVENSPPFASPHAKTRIEWVEQAFRPAVSFQTNVGFSL